MINLHFMYTYIHPSHRHSALAPTPTDQDMDVHFSHIMESMHDTMVKMHNHVKQKVTEYGSRLVEITSSNNTEKRWIHAIEQELDAVNRLKDAVHDTTGHVQGVIRGMSHGFIQEYSNESHYPDRNKENESATHHQPTKMTAPPADMPPTSLVKPVNPQPSTPQKQPGMPVTTNSPKTMAPTGKPSLFFPTKKK